MGAQCCGEKKADEGPVMNFDDPRQLHGCSPHNVKKPSTVSLGRSEGSRPSTQYGLTPEQQNLLRQRRISHRQQSQLTHFKAQTGLGQAAYQLGFAMTQSQNIMAAMTHCPGPAPNPRGSKRYSETDLEDKIRRAKQEMQTVSITNGCLYIDYQFIAKLPLGMKVTV